jgi:ribosomal protein L37AE/L43A
MPNFLDLVCPSCGRDDCVEIAAHIWVRVTQDGTDPDQAETRDHEYHQRSPAICSRCGFVGTVSHFEPQDAA